MKTENFNLKKNDPLISTNFFGTIGGYYQETVVDHTGVYVRFKRSLDSDGSHIRAMNTIKKASKKEVEEVNEL